MISRRDFLWVATASGLVAWPLPAAFAQRSSTEGKLFRHGVASGDPLTDRVMLWTRVTPPPTRSATGPIAVTWQVATDERLRDVVAHGTAQAADSHDFTVKVDAGGLKPGRTYYYAFDTGGERSPIGRTKTLPAGSVDRLRVASVSCSNYPAGFFNVYRCLANRSDLDAVIHLGDYIYEFANGVYGDGTATERVPQPPKEAITLADYRSRYATYRSDVDLQEVHRVHPFIVVWDDHELANDAWSGGAQNHNEGEGDWATRQAAAYQAYLEWMPIRESSAKGIHLYRTLRFGDLADLVMLDTRGLRDQQVPATDFDRLVDPKRTLLGAEQEAWFFDQLRSSQRAGTRWRVLGQQVLFSPLTPPGARVQNTDVWEGYPAARRRIFDFLNSDKITDVAILTGDVHSSWAFDVPADPFGGYSRNSGTGAAAVELVTPAISSPPLFSDAASRERAPMLRLVLPHLKYLDGANRGYVLLDVGRERLQADWYFVATVEQRSAEEKKAVSFVCERGSSRLMPV